MSWCLLHTLREARRRLAAQRALRRGERVDGIGLVGFGLDAVLMLSPAALSTVDPVDRLLRYVNGAAMLPPPLSHYQAAIRRDLGQLVSKAWRERRYPNLTLYRRVRHMARAGAR